MRAIAFILISTLLTTAAATDAHVLVDRDRTSQTCEGHDGEYGYDLSCSRKHETAVVAVALDDAEVVSVSHAREDTRSSQGGHGSHPQDVSTWSSSSGPRATVLDTPITLETDRCEGASSSYGSPDWSQSSFEERCTTGVAPAGERIDLQRCETSSVAYEAPTWRHASSYEQCEVGREVGVGAASVSAEAGEYDGLECSGAIDRPHCTRTHDLYVTGGVVVLGVGRSHSFRLPHPEGLP